MKIYLAGPISGIPDDNAPAFRKAAEELRARGFEVVSPIELDEQNGESLRSCTWGYLLSRDVQIIADGGIQGIVLLPGWENSKGAKLEASLGLLLGIQIYLYADDCRYAPVLPAVVYYTIFESTILKEKV